MDTSLVAALKTDEGFSPTPYMDVGVGGISLGTAVGYGRNLTREPLDEEEASFLLYSSIMKKRAALERQQPLFNKLSSPRKDAILLMAYQMGVAGCLGFKQMWACLEKADWVGAALEAKESKWGRQYTKRAERVVQLLESGKWPSGEGKV